MSDVQQQIEDCVKEFLQNQKISQYKITLDFGVNVSHFISEIAKVEVKGKDKNNKDVHLHLIGKFAKTDKKVRQLMATKHFFEHEIYAYEHVFSYFKQIQEEKNIKDVFHSYPSFCGASNVDLQETLVIENVTPKGFKPYDRSVYLDYNHASLVLKEIGRLHALSFAIRDQYPTILKEITNNIKDVEFRGFFSQNNIDLLYNFYPGCLETLDPINDKIALDRYKNVEKELFEKIKTSVELDSAEPYAVVTHSDLWITNLLFKYDGLGKPSELCFVDWQLTKVCSPASDISQIIFTCIDKQVRDEHYHTLINDYYQSLFSFLQELGSDPNILFPFHVLEEHLRKFSINGLHTAIRMVSLTSIIAVNIPDFPEKEGFRWAAKAKKNPSFNKRMRDILLDYIMYGYEL